MSRALLIVLFVQTVALAESHLLTGDLASRIGAGPLPAPSLANTVGACTPERLGFSPGPLPAPPMKGPSPTPVPGKGLVGVDCTGSGTKYGALFDFYDGTALVHDGANTVTEVGACVMTIGATTTVDCTRGAGEYRLTFSGQNLNRVSVLRGGQEVATLQCEAWNRPAPEQTCTAYFTGYYISPQTTSCVQGGESGCSSPFAFSTLQQCQTALMTPSRRIPLGK